MPDNVESTVPVWVVNMTAEMAAIRTRVEEIPKLVADMEKLRAEAVPMHEHLKLLNDVDILKGRDLGERSDWEEIKMRVLAPEGMLATIWDERARSKGRFQVVPFAVAVIGFIVTALTLFTLLHNLGLSISIH